LLLFGYPDKRFYSFEQIADIPNSYIFADENDGFGEGERQS